MVTTEKPETEKPKTWRQKFLRNWMNTRLGHEGMMLDKILRQNRIVEQLAAQTRNGKFSGGPTPSVPEGEDMGVSIGNEIHHHYGSKPQATVKPPSVLGKLLVAASLLAGGAGAGVLASQLLPGDVPAAVDTDTISDVTFPE
jgi:hypothetical protein